MKSNIRYKSNINNTSIFLIGTLVLFFDGFFPRPSLLLRRTSYPKKPKASDIIEMVDLPMWVYLSLRFWLDICRIIKDIHILWNHGQKHLNKDERKPLSGLDTNSMSNYHEGKAIYISGSVLFMSLEDSTKLPAMVLAWENFQEVFVMLVVVVVFLPHWRFFISLLFDIIPHPSVDYRRVFTPILYFQPSPSQSDLRHFHFQPFRYLLTASATVLSGPFFTHRRFFT